MSLANFEFNLFSFFFFFFCSYERADDENVCVKMFVPVCFSRAAEEGRK